jgi:hypothetical protein
VCRSEPSMHLTPDRVAWSGGALWSAVGVDVSFTGLVEFVIGKFPWVTSDVFVAR